MTGVLMAIPGADYVVHNSVFLVAHYHNMLIPGALFGYFAGFSYWFPKMFGFKLDEKWGKRAFWGWMIGFLVAFMPLYAVGFMGMPRRAAHYDDLSWQPYMITAAIGTAIVGLGIACQVIQLVVSIRKREALEDVTGDAWDGRTLEWATSSPPAEYNFAVVPVVGDLDAFWEMKENGTAWKKAPVYSDIHMPKNQPYGVIIGGLGLAFGFAMIWYIWWLAVVSLAGIIATIIIAGSNDDDGYLIPASEVQRIESLHLERMAQAAKETSEEK
jgi:cytochrome o ubiquinol oxidase subunit 1